MSEDRQTQSNTESADLLAKLRQINKDCASGHITWEERVRRHQELVDGIGDLQENRGRQ